MMFEFTNLETGQQLEWDADVGELIDVLAPWLPLSGVWRRDKPLRRDVYRLQWRLRHGRDSGELEDRLGVAVARYSPGA